MDSSQLYSSDSHIPSLSSALSVFGLGPISIISAPDLSFSYSPSEPCSLIIPHSPPSANFKPELEKLTGFTFITREK